MDLDLKGKVSVIGASSRGLGKAVAIALAKEGSDVVICSRNENRLLKTKKELEDYGTQVLAVTTDLTKQDEVEKLIHETENHFGVIDNLVTNCGGPPSGGFLEFSMEEWRSAINLNLMSTIFLCRATIPIMIKKQSGRIIMIASVSVKQPLPGLILSNVSRAGVAGLAKSLSNEFGRKGIYVNMVCPGYTTTERVFDLANVISGQKNISTEQVLNEWASLNALGRLATPEEFANVVVFLASSKASQLTGVTIQVDGGLVKSLL
ncbi:MAG: SDR family oxidoreductase [Candidatus Hodarchaeales archaeon]|jgi:3-oxoacyl-[acyl-carrier protein] reductase